MSEQLLTILKLCLLVLLYLFFLRVLRAVWVEIKGPKQLERAATPAAAAQGRAPAAAPAPPPPPKGRKAKRDATTALTVVEPAEQRGRTYPLGQELTVGRAAGCQVIVDDTYASQLHARVYARDGRLFVEDLGSTNGTWLNREKVTAPTVMGRGDRLQVGNTVMELA